MSDITGTNIGPPCKKCSGTVWEYRSTNERLDFDSRSAGEPLAVRTTFTPRCCGCHRKDKPFSLHGWNGTAEQARKLHHMIRDNGQDLGR